MSLNPVNPPVVVKDKDATTPVNNGRPAYNRGRQMPQPDEHRINDRIRVPEVRLVGDNIEPGVYPTKKALEMAQSLGLDLVEISDKAVPPVCRAVDYSKFKYEQKKKQKEIKANSQKSVVKEIRFAPRGKLVCVADLDFTGSGIGTGGFIASGRGRRRFHQYPCNPR